MLRGGERELDISYTTKPSPSDPLPNRRLLAEGPPPRWEEVVLHSLGETRKVLSPAEFCPLEAKDLATSGFPLGSIILLMTEEDQTQEKFNSVAI